MKSLAIIDGNAVGFAANSGAKLSAGDQPTQAIFGFLNSLRKVVSTYTNAGGYKPTVVWDGRSWRHSVLSDYKGTRDKYEQQKVERDEYKAQRPLIARATKFLGVPQLIAANWEADDLAGVLVDRLNPDDGDKAVLITGDSDWYQLIQPGVFWFDLRKDKKVWMGNFEQESGFVSPEAYIDAKALQGDTSDNIKGVGGIGEGAAKLILEHYSSVDRLIESMAAGEPLHDSLGRWKKKITAFVTNETGGLDKFRQNNLLMRLRSNEGRPAPERLTLTKHPLDEASLLSMCEELAMFSIARNFDKWMAPFRIFKGATA